MNEFRLVVVGEHETLETHERARKPEKALQRYPDHDIAVPLALSPRRHVRDGLIVRGKYLWPQCQVIVHIADDALNMMLNRLDCGF
ncbi:MAG: hypothetical protein LBM04_08100, partial [Opitutaceae bacterium]|nr:hypothetical protein [Opitutaceae bacterium]